MTAVTFGGKLTSYLAPHSTPKKPISSTSNKVPYRQVQSTSSSQQLMKIDPQKVQQLDKHSGHNPVVKKTARQFERVRPGRKLPPTPLLIKKGQPRENQINRIASQKLLKVSSQRPVPMSRRFTLPQRRLPPSAQLSVCSKCCTRNLTENIILTQKSPTRRQVLTAFQCVDTQPQLSNQRQKASLRTKKISPVVQTIRSIKIMEVMANTTSKHSPSPIKKENAEKEKATHVKKVRFSIEKVKSPQIVRVWPMPNQTKVTNKDK